MEAIQNKAILTYQNNLKYFAKHHKDLSQLLNIFEQAINKGDYAEQFELEYRNGYFDIKELASDKFLYGGNSVEISSDLTKQVDFKKNHLCFEGLPIYNFSEESIEKSSNDDKIISMKGLFPIMRYYAQNTHPSDSMQSIEKFIFIGVGLGLHVPLVHKKIAAKEYFFIEDNVELFRLSLFTTEYNILAKEADLKFSIADSEEVFLKKIQEYMEDTFFYNRYLKYIKFPTHSDQRIKEIQNALITQNFIYFPYKAVLSKELKALEYINDGYNLLNIRTTYKDTLLTKKPVLLLGAGPSFQKNIQWIKKNQNKFVIIAVSATMNTLYKNKIHADFISHIDGSDISVVNFQNLAKTDFFNDTLFLFGSNTPTLAREAVPKEQIFYFDEGNQYVSDSGYLQAPCVGSSSLLLSLLFNTKELYTLGLDLAINQETGESHSSEHLYSQKYDLEHKDKVSSVMDYQKNFFKVEGNFTESVYTNSLLHTSIQHLYVIIPKIKKESQTIHNISEGAKINKTIPTPINDVPLDKYEEIDKTSFSKELSNMLLSHSIQRLNSDDENAMKKRLDGAKEVYHIIESYKNSVSHSNKEKYIYDLLGIVSSISHKRYENSLYKNLSHIYFSFFKYALAIIIDFFNTKNLKNTKRHIKKLDAMIQDEMFDICNIYISSLEKFIKERC